MPPPLSSPVSLSVPAPTSYFGVIVSLSLVSPVEEPLVPVALALPAVAVALALPVVAVALALSLALSLALALVTWVDPLAVSLAPEPSEPHAGSPPPRRRRAEEREMSWGRLKRAIKKNSEMRDFIKI